MPATMMHLAAARRLSPGGSDAYLLGAILPDCVDAHRDVKDRIHFRDLMKTERLPALIRFGKERDLGRDFDFGVLFHLYLDYLWDNGPQKEYRTSHGEEGWFPDYRKELARAGSRAAQRAPWNRETWERLRGAEKSLYESDLPFLEEEIRSFLDFNARWHTEERLPESPYFTDRVVDGFIHDACLRFVSFLREEFPRTLAERKGDFAPFCAPQE